MELFVQLFDTPNEAATDRSTSTLISPMAELAAPPVPLNDVLSADGSVLTKFLEEYANRNAPELAEKFAELSLLIANDEEDFCPSGELARRLLDFVYPVV